MYSLFFKRIIDVVVALFLLILLLPLLLVVCICLYFTNKDSRIFFFQKRPGKNNKIFEVIKFKSMTNQCDIDGNFLPDQKRITKFGRFIRKTSLDELPQLFNVLVGNMSLIGPRPLLVEYLPLYSEKQSLRHSVKPGITGWAQVNGRNAISWQQKFEYDVWYVNNISFILDLKIMYLTIKKVLIKEGINQGTDTTMEKFKGN